MSKFPQEQLLEGGIAFPDRKTGSGKGCGSVLSDHKTLPLAGRVDHVPGFQRCLFSYPYESKVQKVPEVQCQQSDLSFKSSCLWPSNSSIGVHQSNEGSKTFCSIKGYKNPPITSELAAQSSVSGNLETKHPDPLGPMPRPRLGSKLEQIGTYPSVGYHFHLS